MELRSHSYTNNLQFDYNRAPVTKTEFLIPTHFWSIPAFIDPLTFVIGSWDSFIRCYDVETYKLKWQLKTKGPIYSSPTILEDSSFILGGEDGILRRINKDGIVLWNFKGKNKFHATPTLNHEQNIIFATCYDHYVYAIDTQTGLEIWKMKFNENVSDDIYSSPALTPDNNIIFGSGNNIICLSETGQEVWSISVSSFVDATPLIDYKHKIGVAGAFNGSIYGFNIENGNVIWEYNTNNAVTTSPAIYKNVVAVGSDDGFVYGLDILSGTLRWKNYHGQKMLFTPLATLPNGNFCYVTLDEHLWCIDYLTGKTKWRKNFEKYGVHSAPVLSVAGYMVIGSNNGAFYILKFHED